MAGQIRVLAIGCVSPTFGPVVVTSEDALGTVALGEFMQGVNAAIDGADLEDMQTADQVAGYWYAQKRNGAKPLTDDEIAAELEDYREWREDEDYFRRGNW